MTNSTTVYSTSTTGEVFSAIAPELAEELHFAGTVDFDTEYCFVCSRATDHRGEHDDLVEEGLASYSDTTAEVYRLG